MGKSLKLCAAIIVSLLAFGCAQKNGGIDEETKAEYIRQSNTPVLASTVSPADAKAGQKLVKKAHSAIGTPYVLGGSNPGGFDCSGLVKWAYNSIGVELPRTAREQSVVGEKIHNVEDMRAGDIVAFKHPKRGYHTGIYVGDGKFIHSPRKRTRVRINSLSDPYFSSTLLGARRVNLKSGENLVAQAEQRLDQYIAERTTLSETMKSLKARNSQKQNVAKKNVKAVAHNKTKKVAKTANTTTTAKKTNTVKKAAPVATAKKTVAAKTNNHKNAAATKSAKTAKPTAAAKKHADTKTVAHNNVKKTKTTKKATHKTVSMLHKKTATHTSARKNHS